jgi:hypothetical protein
MSDSDFQFATIWWEEGCEAFHAGKGFLDNPYLDEQSDKTRHWVDGYVDALIADRRST